MCLPSSLPCLNQGLLFTDALTLQASLLYQLSGFSCLLPSCCRRAAVMDAHCHIWLYLGSERLVLTLVWQHFSFSSVY